MDDLFQYALPALEILFLATWIGSLPTFALLFVKPLGKHEPRIRALCPRVIAVFAVQIALCVGICLSRFVFTPEEWPSNVIGLVAVSLPAASCLFSIFTNGVFTWSLTKFAPERPTDLSLGITGVILLWGVSMWTAVAQVRAAAPQSEFPTDELALFWVLEAEVLFSLWLLFRQCDRVARSFNQPQVFAGYLRWLLLGQAIAFSWGTAHLPNF